MRFTFVQLRAFTAEARHAGLSGEDLRGIENEIMRRPLAWPLMAGTGGVRKMRYAPQASGRGKSGGVRVCYFLAEDAGRVYLMNVFAKNEKGNLSAAECGTIKQMIARLKANLKKELSP